MAEKSILWTTGALGDGTTTYTEAEVTRWMRQTFKGADDEGVHKNWENELAATGAATPVQIDTGAAYNYGFPYWNTTPVNVAIATPVVSTRTDRIVLRATWATATVRITHLANPAEGTGVPPGLTQVALTTWDIPLWRVDITIGGVITLTDERVWLHPNIAVELAMMEDDSVDSDQYVDGSVDRIHLEADIIDGTKLEDNAVNVEHVNVAVAGDGLGGGGGAALLVNTDNVTIEKNADALRVKDLGIVSGKLGPDAVIAGKIQNGAVDVTATLANNIVDDTKVGNRVPQFYRRQGGSATDWFSAGTTVRTPGAVRMQGGMITWTGSSATFGWVLVTLNPGFSYKPLPFADHAYSSYRRICTNVWANSTTQITIYWYDASGASHTTLDFTWLAIGPE